MNTSDPDYSNYIGLRHLNPEMIRTLRLGLSNGAKPESFIRKMKRERVKEKDNEVHVRMIDSAIGAIRFMVRNQDAGIIRWTEGEQYVFVEMENVTK